MTKLVATAILVLASLYIWRTFYGFHCGTLILPLAFALIVTLHAVDFNLARRRAFATYFFTGGSFLYRLFHRRLLTILLAFAGAVFTAALFMLDLIIWSDEIALLLAADAVLLALIYPRLDRLTAGSMMPVSRRIGLKHFVALLNTALLLGAVFYLQLNQTIPSYIDKGLSFSKTVSNASARIVADCPWLETAVRLNAKKEAAGWWLMMTVSPFLEASYARWGGWSLFLVSSMLGLWAFSRFLTQLYDMVLRIDQNARR